MFYFDVSEHCSVTPNTVGIIFEAPNPGMSCWVNVALTKKCNKCANLKRRKGKDTHTDLCVASLVESLA